MSVDDKKPIRPSFPSSIKPPPKLPGGSSAPVPKNGSFPKLPPKPFSSEYTPTVSPDIPDTLNKHPKLKETHSAPKDASRGKLHEAESIELADNEALAFWKFRGNNRKHAFKKEASRWGKRLSLAATVVIPITLFMSLFQFNTIPSSSMEPTVGKSDIVMSWRFGDKSVSRGNVVIFNGEGTDWGNKLYLKRVIGIGGDSLKCCETDSILINGEELEEPYIHGKPSKIGFQHEIKKGTFFALGDNRNDSKDSRYHVDAYISEEKVVAKPFLGFSLSGFRFYTL